MVKRISSGSQAAQLDCVSAMEHNFSTYSRTPLAHVSVRATTRGRPDPELDMWPGCDIWHFFGNSSQLARLGHERPGWHLPRNALRLLTYGPAETAEV